MVSEEIKRSEQQQTLGRRTFLRTAAAAGAVWSGTSLASAAPSHGRENSGFPPKGTTDYGREVELGNGTVRPFTTETPSGEPKYHGVELDRAALDDLPSAEDLEDSGEDEYDDKESVTGEALEVHFKWSLEFFVEFPSAENTPFTFLGLNWNPGGHFGGKGAWLKPHFDIHFHILDTETIDGIGGPKLPPYDTGNGEYTDGKGPDLEGRVTETEFNFKQLPEGYSRSPDPVADQRYITDMGEHTAPSDAPELPDGPGESGDPEKFDNTLIQGFVGPDGDGQNPELAFVEPMVTKEFLEDVSGTESYGVPQPEEYPHDQQHPMEYSVRDVPSKNAISVVIQDFEQI
jgi:hypothetical protein